MKKKTMRKFSSGASRDKDEGKLQYTQSFSPLALKRAAQHMLNHNDKAGRRCDDWKQGFPLDSFLESGKRHFQDWWLHHEGYPEEAEEDLETALSALLFNVQGYLHQLLKEKHDK